MAYMNPIRGLFNRLSTRTPTIDDLLRAIDTGEISRVAAAITPKNINAVSRNQEIARTGASPLSRGLTMLMIRVQYIPAEFVANEQHRRENLMARQEEEKWCAIITLLIRRGADPASLFDGDGQRAGHCRMIFRDTCCWLESHASGQDWELTASRAILEAPRILRIAKLFVDNDIHVAGMFGPTEIPGLDVTNSRLFTDEELAQIFINKFESSVAATASLATSERLNEIHGHVRLSGINPFLMPNIETLCDISPERAANVVAIMQRQIVSTSKFLDKLKTAMFVGLTMPFKTSQCLAPQYISDDGRRELKQAFVAIFGTVVTLEQAIDLLKNPQLRSALASKAAAISSQFTGARTVGIPELTLMYKALLCQAVNNLQQLERCTNSLQGLSETGNTFAQAVLTAVQQDVTETRNRSRTKPA